MTYVREEAPANFVPAAAVRRGGRALSGIIGRKGFVGCIFCYKLKYKFIFILFILLNYLSIGEDSRILYIGVKSNNL